MRLLRADDSSPSDTELNQPAETLLHISSEERK